MKTVKCSLLFMQGIALGCAFLLPSTLAANAQKPLDKAWSVLQSGLQDKTTEERVIAVRMLGLLENDSKAPDLALNAMKDEKPEIRAAAANALGQMKAKSAADALAAQVLNGEQDASVVIACAIAMIELGDERGYGVYYAILTGEKKSGATLLESQKKMLNDPKQMAQMGFEVGIGFVPFGGLGYKGFKMLTKDESIADACRGSARSGGGS
jgi:hypothetical protein